MNTPLAIQCFRIRYSRGRAASLSNHRRDVRHGRVPTDSTFAGEAKLVTDDRPLFSSSMLLFVWILAWLSISNGRTAFVSRDAFDYSFVQFVDDAITILFPPVRVSAHFCRFSEGKTARTKSQNYVIDCAVRWLVGVCRITVNLSDEINRCTINVFVRNREPCSCIAWLD